VFKWLAVDYVFHGAQILIEYPLSEDGTAQIRKYTYFGSFACKLLSNYSLNCAASLSLYIKIIKVSKFYYLVELVVGANQGEVFE